MSMDKHKEIYNNIKNIAKDYNIEVLIPKARPVQSNVLEDTMLFSSNLRSMMDNVISITIDKSPNSVKPVIIKNRNPCEITECIKANNQTGLVNYLNKLQTEEKDINKKQGIHYYRFTNNFTYLLNNNPPCKEIFWETLENSELFKEVVSDKNKLWIEVAFQADNYSFLRSKVKLPTILKHEKLQNLIKDAKSNNILEQLLKEETFIDYLENNFKLINFIGISNNDCLEVIFKKINYHQKIDLSNLYQKYTQYSQDINKSGLHFKWFNATIKKCILYSNYLFTKEDESLEVLNEENQQLIVKKRLNQTLQEKFVAKPISKRKKI